MPSKSIPTQTKKVAPKNPSSAAATASDDPFFGDQNSVKMSFKKFTDIGDKVKGVFVERYIAESNLNPGIMQENYVLLDDAGERIVVSGRGARKSDGLKVIFGMEKIPLGAIIGFIYTGDLDTGNIQPAKVVEVRYAGERDLGTLKSYQAKFAPASQVASETAKVTAELVKDPSDEDRAAVAGDHVDPELPDFGADGE